MCDEWNMLLKNVEKKIQRSRARQSWTKKWRFSLNKVSLLVWWSFRLSRHCSEYLKGFSSSLCYSNIQFWVKSIGLRMTTIQVRVHTSSHHKFSKINFLHNSHAMSWYCGFHDICYNSEQQKKSRELSDMSGAMKKKAESNITRHVFVDKSNFFPGQTFLSWLCGWLAVGSIWFTLHSTCCVFKLKLIFI